MGSGALKEEREVWSSQGGEKDKLFFPYILSLSHIKRFFSFKPRADDYTTKQLSLNSVVRII